MKQIRRHHRPEFKREAVALVVEHGYCCTAAGRSLGVAGKVNGKLIIQEPFLARVNNRPSSNGSMNWNRKTAVFGWSVKS